MFRYRGANVSMIILLTSYDNIMNTVATTHLYAQFEIKPGHSITNLFVIEIIIASPPGYNLVVIYRRCKRYLISELFIQYLFSLNNVIRKYKDHETSRLNFQRM